MLKSIFAGITGFGILASSAAFAADLPRRHHDPVEPVPFALPAFTWTGFYAGVNAGGAWSSAEKTRMTDSYGLTAPIPGKSDGAGFTGGGQIGYNYQIGSFVVGAEADLNYAQLKQRNSLSNMDYGHVEGKSTLEWFGTLRGRLGVLPTDRFLVYGTGGLAYGSVKNEASAVVHYGSDEFVPDTWSGRKSSNQMGWTLGVGAEYALMDNLTLRGEYLYVDLGKTSHTGAYTGSDPVHAGTTFSVRKDTKFSVVRAGLNWKFSTF